MEDFKINKFEEKIVCPGCGAVLGGFTDIRDTSVVMNQKDIPEGSLSLCGRCSCVSVMIDGKYEEVPEDIIEGWRNTNPDLFKEINNSRSALRLMGGISIKKR